MRIGIAGTQTTELVAKSIKETLSDAGFESFYFKNNSKVFDFYYTLKILYYACWHSRNADY